MPLYEYQCDVCSHRFEVIRKFSDAPLEVCEKCGGAVKKLPSSPAFQFKGTGWYITDYARKGATEGKEAKGTPATESKDDSKKDDSKSTTTSSTDSSATATPSASKPTST